MRLGLRWRFGKVIGRLWIDWGMEDVVLEFKGLKGMIGSKCENREPRRNIN